MQQRMLLGCVFAFLYLSTCFAQNTSCDHQHRDTHIGHQIFESLNEEMADMLATMAQNIEENKCKEGFTLPSTCFAPDADASEVEKFYKAFHDLKVSLGIADVEKYNNTSRWSSTATDGGGLVQGDLTTLTWSYVPDGTEIANNCFGDPGDVSDFIDFFNNIYGGPTTPGDLTTAPWHQKFVDMFEDWSSKTGLTFVYEANDDGVPYASNIGANPGVLGTRGDIRIGGARIDGNSGILACNYFPQVGDMIIDTDDNFYSNNSGLGVDNILAHEVGHGIGIRHVCPVDQTKLMEPFISTAFDGPQEDDYLASNRHYGDNFEGDDALADATDLGAINSGVVLSECHSNDDDSDEDFFSFSSNADAAAFSVAMLPTGTTYLEGAQNGDGSCQAGTSFDAQAISDLQLKNWQGGMVGSTSNGNGPGVSENLAFTRSDPTALEEFSVDQQVLNDDVQIYDFQVVVSASVTDKSVGACDPANDEYTLDFTANWANESGVMADISLTVGGVVQPGFPRTLAIGDTYSEFISLSLPADGSNDDIVLTNSAYAITLTETNTAPSSCAQSTSFDVSVSDPCSCNNDATLDMSDGTFAETVTVGTNPPTTGLTILVGDGSTGLIGINIGDAFTDNGDGTYEISFDHADGVGYTMNVAQDMTDNIVGTISNTCYYPVPAIDNLASDYCENDPVVNLMGSAQLGDLSGPATAETETWSGPGVTGSDFDPSAAGPGMHTIIYEFDAQDNNPDAQHPGCISSVSQAVEVNAQPDAPMVDDVEVCDGEDTTIEPQAGGGGGGMMTALREDFEDDVVEYTTSQAECSDGFGDFFIRTDGSDIGTFVEYFTPVGSNYFAVMDTDGSPCVESPTSMLFSDIDITGLTNIEFCVYLAEDDDGSNEDWDISDFVHFDYDIDNSGTFSPMIWVESEPDGDDFNAVPKIDTDFDGDGDGAEITPTFTQYCFTLPVTGTDLDIEIEFALNAGDEDIAIDEVTVTGEASAVDCTFNYYDEDPDANPDAMPIAMGDTYDPMTTVGNSPETYWVTCVDDMTGCESEATEVTVTVNALPAAPDVSDVEVCEDEKAVITPTSGGGQMVMALLEDFEDDVVEYTASQAECSDGFGDFFIRTDGSDIGSFVDYFTPVGSSYFAVMDTDGSPCVESPTSMFFSDIDISGLTDIEFCVYLAEDDDGSNEDWDVTDYVHFDYDIDNSGTFSPMIWVESEPDGDDFNAVPKIDTDFDGDGDGSEITPTFTQYCFSIPGTGTEVDIEIEFALNAGDEDIAIDEVSLKGMGSGSNPAPMLIASDNFDAPLNLTARSNTTDQGTQPDHEDQFTTPGDLFGITDGQSGTPMPRQAPFAIVDDAADPACNGFFPFDDQGVLPCNYGNNYFGVVDTENGENMGTVSADWTFDVSAATAGVSLICIDMGAMGDFESSDDHTWSVDIDGGGFNEIFMLQADEAATATYDITNGPETLNDPMTLNGQQILNGLTTFCAEVNCEIGNELTLRLETTTNGGSEAVAYDNIEIYGSSDPNQVVYKFYDQDPAGGGVMPVFCGPEYCPETTPATSPETYWVTAQSCEGCESEATEVTVTVNAVPDAPTVDDVVVCEDEKPVIEPMASGMSSAPMLIASDDFDSPVGLNARSNTTDQGTQPDHEDQFTTPGDLFGITDGQSGTPMPRQAPFAIVDDAADPACNGFFPFDDQGVLPCNYGNNYFGVVDTENGENMGTVSADWTFDVSSATAGVSLICIDMGAMGDFESSDDHTWSVDIDGGGFNQIFMLEADEAATATYDITNGPETLNDPMTLNGQQILNGLTTFCAEVNCEIGNELTLRLETTTNGGSEAVAYDNIEIYGSTDPNQVVFKFYDQVPSAGGIDPVHCGPDYCPPTTLATSPETYWVTAESCEGCESEATEVQVTINPIPTVDPTDDMVHCDGDNVPGYMFTGAPAGTEFDWTASEDVGFGTMGTGDVPPYTATTNGAVVPVVSEVIVTPRFTNLGVTCVGEPDTFLVTVNPTPDADQVDDIEACDGDVVPTIMLTGSVPGTVFNWTNDNTSIGLGASGMGDIPSFTAVNPGPTIQVANIEVTPTFTNAGVTCTGDVMTFTITVFPLPIIEFARDSLSICKFDSLDLSLIGADIIDNGSGVTDGDWSTTGDGIFVPDTRFSNAMSYEPGPMDIDNNLVFIILTTDDPVGPCGPVADTVKVVLEDPPPMSCTDFQASLGNDGTYLVTAADALTTIPVDWTSYSVVVEDANGEPIFGSPVLNCSHIGQELYVKVTENCGGNSCWSRVFVEDKIEPVLSCPAPASFSCIDDSAPGQVQTRRFETTPNVAIGPDAGDVTNIVQTVPNYGNVAIQGVNVYIDFNFDNIVDFFNAGGVTLTSPEGTTYDMYPIFINPNCQLLFGVDGADHGFDDSSPQALAFCQDINSGSDLVPIGASLDASFAGEDPEGQWTWAFTDAFDAQGGTVNRLVIELDLVNTLEMPIVQENCDYELTYEDITDNRNACGIGTVIREWKATDESGNTGTCTQTLIFENIDPPTVNPPADYEADCFVDPISLTPDVTGEISVIGNDDCAQYAIGYDDLFLDDCAPYGYKIRRSWTVLDWCDEEFLFEHDQIIKIVDEEAPVISCPADFTVSLRHNDCETNVSLPTATAIDNCDFDVDIDRELLDPNGVVIGTSNVPVGRYSARYIATDACGNTDTCYVWVQVIDPVAPVVVTNRNLVVSLTAGGWAYLCADQVDDGSNDNCTDVGIYIKKEGDDNGEYWRNFDRNDNCVRFQCRDLGENQVKLRVYDDADGDGFFGPQEDTNNDGSIDENDRNGDNYNEAWATVLVEDKLPPILICPPDISVNCEADFNDLDITGEAEADLNCDREDPTYTDRLPDGNCPGSDIVRTWRVEKRLPGYDGVEGTADDLVWVRSCEQLITITDDTPVTIEKLPLDITIDCTGGAVGTDPDDLRKYNFFDDYLNTPQNPGDDSLVVYDNPVIDYDCEDLGINYEDQQFGLCMPGSYKIRRNWTIIDWCDDEYEVAYTQVIFVDDKEAPELTVNNPGTVIIDNNDTQCGTFADITASAFDLCSNVSITNNSPYGPGTHDASGTYPQGTYSITFTAIDGCGNVATEEITVNVVDGKAPTAVCKYGIAGGLKQNCDLILSADYFDAGSTDNCSVQSNLSFEVARVDSLGNYIDRAESILFDCFDATNDNGGNVRVALFVIDGAGNEAVCETVIDVQAGECPLCDDIADPPSLNVTGTVIKENGDLVNGVEILLDGQSQGMINGNYGMLIDKDRRTGMAYASIEALKADVVDNGVSTRDLVKIRRDILRIEQLNHYQDVAADVNNDERVSTLDMVEIRQAILKQIDAFTQVPSWRFVPAAHQFGAHTWETPVPFVYEVASSEQELHVDFIAVKMGDVTGDADVNSSRSTGTFNVKVAEAELQVAEQSTVSIYTDEFQDITGYQFTLQFDPAKVELLDITGNVEDYNFNFDKVDRGLIAVSKVTNDTEGNELFQLNFEVLQTTHVSDLLRINSEITRAEAYNRSSELLDIELTVEGSEASYALYQNVPNPFDNLTRIGFHMAEAGEATLVIMDNQGKVLTERKGYYQAGHNSETFNRAQLPASGLYYYQLKARDFTATKKMLVVN